MVGPSLSWAVGEARRLLQADASATAGIELGEVDLDRLDTSVVTPAMERAADLCRQGTPGRIVLSATAGRLLDVGATGAAAPSATVPDAMELLVAPADGHDLPPITEPMPRALVQELARAPVPRVDQGAVLADAFADARTGTMRVVLVEGEAGAGKTHLLAVFAREVARSGGLALYGAATESPGIPFQAFVDALRPLVPAADGGGRVITLTPEAADDLARILSRPAGPAGEPEPAVTTSPLVGDLDAGGDRYWAFEAVVDLLGAVGERVPVALLLDDVHW
ncbi:MAG: AAA family ATPase, partial [Acidimicrobiia bacterium]|nr:AAA family ATPase [Acidimicrobiia bacterium]